MFGRDKFRWFQAHLILVEMLVTISNFPGLFIKIRNSAKMGPRTIHFFSGKNQQSSPHSPLAVIMA